MSQDQDPRPPPLLDLTSFPPLVPTANINNNDNNHIARDKSRVVSSVPLWPAVQYRKSHDAIGIHNEPLQKQERQPQPQPQLLHPVKPTNLPRRSKSSSPEKLRHVRREPYLRLPPYCACEQVHDNDRNVDNPAQKSERKLGEEGNVVSTADSPRSRRTSRDAGTTPEINCPAKPHDNDAFRDQKGTIDQQMSALQGLSTRLRAATPNQTTYPALTPTSPGLLSYAAYHTGSAREILPPRFSPPTETRCIISPRLSPIRETSDQMATIGGSEACSTSSVFSDSISTNDEADSWTYASASPPSPGRSAVPACTYLFDPRLPPVDTNMYFNGPVPQAWSCEHARMIKDELTKFHLAVYIVDEMAGEDTNARMDGLRGVCDELMPGLRWLGVEPQSIVFFYHGRGEKLMGFDVWDAMKGWARRQERFPSHLSMAYGARAHLAYHADRDRAIREYEGHKRHWQSLWPRPSEEKMQEERKAIWKPAVGLAVPLESPEGEDAFRYKRAKQGWMDFAEYQKLHEGEE